MKDLEQVEVRSIKELRLWLKNNHTQKESVWIVIYKKSKPEFYISWSELVDQLLCFGWIDSVPYKVDEFRTKRLIAPRRKSSIWSLVNKKKVAQLKKQGLMTNAGLEVIKRAKRDGSWTFLDDVDKLIVPDDLLKEFKLYPNALKYFEAFPRGVKHGILYWIKSAKKPETRESRIIETAFLASENVRANRSS